MYTVLTVFHLMICAFLIFIVLIQSSKGSELGAAFGGSNQTLFGSRGTATFLNKLTTGVAVVFMLTSLSLAVLSFKGGSIMPEKIPAKELPVKPFPYTTPGPVQGQPAAGGQEQAQESPSQPAETKW